MLTSVSPLAGLATGALFLMSDESSFVAGAEFAIDGGMAQV